MHQFHEEETEITMPNVAVIRVIGPTQGNLRFVPIFTGNLYQNREIEMH